MSLLRCYYDPLSDFDRLFDNAFATRLQSFVPVDDQRRDSFRPRVDIHESEDANTVTATFELPGMKPDDVTVDVHQNQLTVAGEVKDAHTQEEGGYAIRERRYGKFTRMLQLPFGTKPDDVKAKIDNGVLTVTFPRTTPEQQAQRISIQ